MSADNWAICPSCRAAAHAKYAADLKAVMDMYGTVHVDEFDAARAALAPVKDEDYRTFREDYEFYGTEDGTVIADYRGHWHDLQPEGDPQG